MRAALIAVALASLAIGYGIARHEAQGPRLIGHGCAGAGGDLWAAEESDFPTQCEAIERWQ